MRAAARLSIVALGFALVHVPLAIGDPSDPFSAALPSRDTKAPEPMRGASESSVDEQVGAATYRYPIEVPPGRRNVEPELALTYSSGAPLRGGVAVGWSLDLPVIERDPDFPNEVRYRSTLSGSSGRLVPSPQDPGLGTRYRAEVDDSFFRYDLDLGSGYWTVRSPDGTVYEFWQVADGRALLTRQVDAFGNEMGYAYTRVTFNGHAEYVPAAIEYTSNWANNVAPHARVVFNYAADQSCGGIPLGASVDYHFGKKRISGSKRLQSIQTWAKNTPTSAYRLVRQYALSYDQAELSCSASALRYLTQLDVTAYNPQGVGSVAPSVRLGYGPKQRTLSRTLQPSWSPHEVGTHLGAKSGFLDVNGDGRADYISVVTRADGCYIEWRSGFGDGNFSLVPASFKLPSAAWRAGSPGGHESCTLSGQVASRPGVSNRTYCSPRSVYVNYQFVDYDGDGRLDILSSLSGDHADARGDFMFNTGIFYFADNGSGGGCPLGTTQHGEVENGVRNCACNSGSTYDSFLGACTSQCAPGESFNAVTGSCSTRDACPSCPSGPQNPGGPLCSPAPQEPQRVGPDYVWYLQRFVGAQLAPLSLASRVYSPMPLPAGGAATTLAQPTTRPNVPTLVDFDGDGWLDVVSLVGGAPTTVPPPIGDLATSRGIYVWRGNGTDRFGPKLLWAFPAGWLQEAERVSTASPGIVISTMTLELRDMNGDGAADIVAQQVPTGQPGTGATIGVAYNMPGGTSPLPNVGTIGGSFTPMTSFEIVSPIARMRNELLEWG
ncbi:MAG TPA: SpvB/TcaC N-terminal domain-containing protein, partial [Kofleriaceae bacterium]|nr:SpvB/TcaC N-terminal domain-containing protein [Kofleriaceae bacterium]